MIHTIDISWGELYFKNLYLTVETIDPRYYVSYMIDLSGVRGIYHKCIHRSKVI